MKNLENRIETALQELSEADRTVLEEQEKAKRVTENLRALYDEMQISLQEGSYEAKDKILGGVIAIYGRSVAEERELIDDFKNLNQKLKGKIGERVLIISRHEDQMGCTGFGGEKQIVTRTEMMLGELNGEDLVFNHVEQTCSLPTSRFAFFAPRKQSLGEEVAIEESNIVIAYKGFGSRTSVNLAYDIRHTVGDYVVANDQPLTSERFPALEILVGSEEIEFWHTSNESTYGRRRNETYGLKELKDNLQNRQVNYFSHIIKT